MSDSIKARHEENDDRDKELSVRKSYLNKSLFSLAKQQVVGFFRFESGAFQIFRGEGGGKKKFVFSTAVSQAIFEIVNNKKKKTRFVRIWL